MSEVNVVRQTGDPSRFSGCVWIAQDVQTKEVWKSIVAEISSRLGLYPVIIAYTKQDADEYAGSIPDVVPVAVVQMDDYYAHIVEGRKLGLSERELESSIAERERRFGVSMLRSTIQSDRHLGRDFLTGAKGFAHSKISRKRDRKAIYEACHVSFAFWEGLLARFRPSLCLSYAGGAGLAGRPLALLLRAEAIPFRNMSYSRFGDRFYWAEDEFGFSERFAPHFARIARDDPALSGELSDVLGKQVLTSPEMRAALFKNHSWPGVMRKAARTALRHVAGFWKGYAKSRRGYLLISLLASIVRARLHRDWLDKHAVFEVEKRAGGRKIVYHALQVEPELTTTLFGEFASDQLGLVREISLSLPADAVLAVKEHPWQIGSRDLEFYKRIAALPNTILVHPNYPSINLIRSSRAVSTGSSSVAYEAAAMGIAAFHVQERSLLDVVPHAVALRARRDVERIRQAMAESEVPAAKDRRKRDGIIFLKALMSFGFGVGETGLLNRKAPPAANVVNDLFSDLIASLPVAAPPQTIAHLERGT